MGMHRRDAIKARESAENMDVARELGYLLTRNMNNLYGTRDRVQEAILDSDWLGRLITEARAEAWDEGYQLAHDTCPYDAPHVGPTDDENPYRARSRS